METKDKNRSRRSPANPKTGREQRSRKNTHSGKKRQADAPKRRTSQQKVRSEAQNRRQTDQTQKKYRSSVRRQRNEMPEVVYTPPKPFNSAAFLLRLATAVAVVLAVVFAVSIFFRVQTVNVSGTEKYTPWDILQASASKKAIICCHFPRQGSAAGSPQRCLMWEVFGWRSSCRIRATLK